MRDQLVVRSEKTCESWLTLLSLCFFCLYGVSSNSNFRTFPWLCTNPITYTRIYFGNEKAIGIPFLLRKKKEKPEKQDNGRLWSSMVVRR